ncbi:MAG TPA: DbpA RNA binding domain-containing protein, partial [Longimicrobiales bacterium]|nr:DbpA RNA binding domain-containing protein [Longimicrobiales bacterium]
MHPDDDAELDMSPPGEAAETPTDPDASDVSAETREVTDEELVEAAGRLGHRALPEAVSELATVARRGRDLAVLAGEGSGVELLYALGAASVCDPDSAAVQALVLCPTPERAARAARALHLLGAPVGLAALAWSSWRAASEEERPFAQLVAGRPTELLPRVRAGRLSLGDLRLVAVDGVSALEATGQWDAAEAILDTLPAGAQKVVVDVERGERFEGLLTHRLGRARKWPPELLGAGSEPPSGGGGPPLVWASGADEEERYEALAGLLREATAEAETPRAVVRCPDGDVAHRVAAALASMGFDLTHEPDEPGVVVAWGEDEPPPESVGVLFGLPGSLGELGWLDRAEGRGAVVADREEGQLLLTARRAGWSVRALPAGPDVGARDAIAGFRDRVRRRVEAGGDAAEALVLEPLLRDHGAVPVARALSGLLRERGDTAAAEPAAEEPRRRPETPVSRARGRRPPEPREAAEGAWTRLYVNAGKRDGVGPGDLVGAITGETSLTGDQIGRIDVRESYALVDVA